MNMKEIFIHEWKIQDYSGRRDRSMKSEDTINGEHIYACLHLTSWFRLGKYLIKHDKANYLLGLTKHMSRDEFRDSVKFWDWNKETRTGKMVSCVDEIVRVVNDHFNDNDYLLTLMLLQDELQGYEKCVHISAFYCLPFDYVSFIKDKDAYQKRLEDYVKEVREKEKKNCV